MNVNIFSLNYCTQNIEHLHSGTFVLMLLRELSFFSGRGWASVCGGGTIVSCLCSGVEALARLLPEANTSNRCPVDNFGTVVGENPSCYGILPLWAVNRLSIVCWVVIIASCAMNFKDSVAKDS